MKSDVSAEKVQSSLNARKFHECRYIAIQHFKYNMENCMEYRLFVFDKIFQKERK